MAINFGNDKIKEIYHGSDKIKEVYHGSELVYTAHDPRGYWVHKDTGVKTYFGLEDPSIRNGIMNYVEWGYDSSEVKIPDGVTGLGDSCFEMSLALTSITLPKGVTSFGDNCFFLCLALTSINIPEGVTSIGLNCFNSCSSLTSITIPESVRYVKGAGFYGCPSLTLATVLPAYPPTLGTDVFTGAHSTFKIKVNPPYVNAYKTATNWNVYSSKISAI